MSNNSDSENESENTLLEKDYESTLSDKPLENTENKIELQLGDVIEIQNPINEQLNNKRFIIDYIDKKM